MSDLKFSLHYVCSTIRSGLKSIYSIRVLKENHLSRLINGIEHYVGAECTLDDGVYSVGLRYAISDDHSHSYFSKKNINMWGSKIEPIFLKKLITRSFKNKKPIRYEGHVKIPDFILTLINTLAKTWDFYVYDKIQLNTITYNTLVIVAYRKDSSEQLIIHTDSSHETNTLRIDPLKLITEEAQPTQNQRFTGNKNPLKILWSKICTSFLKA